MRKHKKALKDYLNNYDFMVAVLGIILLIFIILSYLNPEVRLFLILAFASGGLINILNGLKHLKDKARRSMGFFYLFFGILLIMIGVFASNIMFGNKPTP